MLLGAVAQRGVPARDLAQPRQLAVERVAGVEAVVHRRLVGAEVVVLAGAVVTRDRVAEVVVLRRERREHVLPRVLVAARAGEALLVAVVDDRVPAREVHQRVREPVALQQFGLARTRVRVAHEHADAPAVVVAEERGQVVDVRVAVGEPVVIDEQVPQVVGLHRVGGKAHRRRLEREVQHALDLVMGREVRQDRPAVVLGDLAEHVEVADALGAGVALDRRREDLPELVVDVLHRVHPEAVDPEVADPALVDVDHPVDHARLLGEEVVEAEEVAVQRVLAGERRVPAVVVERHVVQPRRHLHLALGLRHERLVGEARRGRQRREGVRAGVVAVVEDRAGRGLVRRLVLGAVRHPRTLAVLDDVRGVVGDDVEVDLDAAAVGGVHERPQVRVGPEVRVDLREVRDPVAVVAGRVVLGLDGLVLERRREPDRGRPEALDVVELADQALEVTAVVPALAGRVEAGLAGALPGREPAVVVRGRPVREPVGHDEVEVLVRDRGAQAGVRAGVMVVGDGRWGTDGQRCEQHREPRATCGHASLLSRGLPSHGL